jgi:tRNA 2-selenouridine synthase
MAHAAICAEETMSQLDGQESAKAAAARARNAQGTLPADFAYADLAQFDAIIDVRSPGEFAEDHMPGALNHPVLDNAERAMVGTLHKQASAFEAKKVGAALVARNIAQHLETHFRDMPRGWRPLIYCWRGGSRSGAMTHILRSVGWHAAQLEGGYKSYRAAVRRDLDELPLGLTFHVICGRTGSGKSRLLESLAASGAQVLDLEQLAAHRGSVLGNLPDAPQPTQKTFDSLIWRELHGFDPARPVFVEAESRKVGLLRVPEVLMEHMRGGRCFFLDTVREARIELLRDDYRHLIADRALLESKLDCLVGLHSNERIADWKKRAAAQDWDGLVSELLDHHYDPAYGKSMSRNYRNIDRAERIVVEDVSPPALNRMAARLTDAPRAG